MIPTLGGDANRCDSRPFRPQPNSRAAGRRTDSRAAAAHLVAAYPPLRSVPSKDAPNKARAGRTTTCVDVTTLRRNVSSYLPVCFVFFFHFNRLYCVLSRSYLTVYHLLIFYAVLLFLSAQEVRRPLLTRLRRRMAKRARRKRTHRRVELLVRGREVEERLKSTTRRR